jgi:hypothetical protein
VRLVLRIACAVVWISCFGFVSAQAQQAEKLTPEKLMPERLTFGIEWRLIRGGTAVMETKPGEARVKLDSAGLVSTLFKVDDTYTVRYDAPFCAASSLLDAQQGKRHQETSITFDRYLNRATFTLRDVLKNSVIRAEQTEIPSCVHDIVGGIQMMRTLNLEPGQAAQLPISDGRKSAQVRIEAQEREEIQTTAGKFKTIRYEANLFNGVIYMRKGRAFVWLTDDARKLPVQMQLRMSFPLGNVTVTLEKEERP